VSTSDAQYSFAANGLYDPNITGTGHQPMGFDQIMLAFRHYVVVSSTATATLSNPAAVTGDLMYVTLSCRNETTAATVTRQIEIGNCTYSLLQGNVDLGGYGATVQLTKSVNIAQFKGWDDILDVYLARGDSAGNPGELVYWTISSVAPNIGMATTPMDILMVIDYDVIFIEPITLTQS